MAIVKPKSKIFSISLDVTTRDDSYEIEVVVWRDDSESRIYYATDSSLKRVQKAQLALCGINNAHP